MDTDESWVTRSACRGSAFDGDHVDFFPDETDRKAVKAAQKVCWGCHARLDCLDYALDNHIREGIWGGLTARDRSRARRREGKLHLPDIAERLEGVLAAAVESL